MDEREFEELDDEELEMLMNGLIHPDDFFTPPDLTGGSIPLAPGASPSPFPTGSFDDLIARAYDDESDDA